MIIDTMKKDSMKALKDGDKQKNAFLGYVIGQLSNTEKMIDGKKVVSDASAVKTIKMLIKQTADDGPTPEAIAKAKLEKKILEAYLPTPLTEDEIRDIISKNATSMPEAMKFLTANYSGLYDGAIASKIAKEMF